MEKNIENKDIFIKRLVGFSIGPIVNALLGLITVPLTTWFLFPEELGKAAMFTTALELLSPFIYLGLTQSYPREYHSSENKSKLLYNCIFLPLLISLVIMIISMFFRAQISQLVFGEFSLFGMILFCIAMPLKVIESFALSVIRMKEKAKLYSLFQILKKVASFSILLVFFIFISPTYHAVLIASIGSIFVSAIFEIYSARETWKEALKSKPDMELLKRVLAFGLPLIPAAAITWIFQSADKVALRNYTDFQQIGYYSGAFKVVALLTILKKSFSSFWIPTSYRWFETNVPINKFQKLSDSLMSMLVLLSCLVILFRNIIFQLLSEKYLPSAYVIPFLLYIPIVSTVSQTTNIGIQFKRKNHLEIYAALIVAVINVVGNMILVPLYGAVGASVSTGLSYIVYFYIRSYISRRVWEKINLTNHTINLILLTALSFSTLLKEQLFILELAITMTIIIYNMKNNLYVFKSIKQMLLKRKSRS